jgi:hypothetical protein
MRRLTPSALLASCVVLLCAAVAALAATSAPSAASSTVLRAPAATPARAAADVAAVLARAGLPAGSSRIAAPSPALVAALQGPSFNQPFATFASARQYWTLPSGAGGGPELPAPRIPGASVAERSGDGSPAITGVQWRLPTGGRWFGPRWLAINAIPDPGAAGRWLALVEATVVWTPWRLELPRGVRSVVVRRAQGGAVLARVANPARVARVLAAVGALAVDDAVHAVYACPFLPAGFTPGVELSFLGASGNVVATAATEFCPQDLSLTVRGGRTQRLILDGFLGRLAAIVGRRLPAAL